MLKKIKDILKISFIPIIVASLCCLSPLIIFLLGLSTVTFASSLADFFYGEWKWGFRLFGLFLLIITLVFYFRKKGICSLNKIKRNKNKIINTILISIFIFVIGYIFFLYYVVHYIGVWVGLWV
jgi:ABC-type multidrug transport system fused ATPase/permease subunit